MTGVLEFRPSVIAALKLARQALVDGAIRPRSDVIAKIDVAIAAIEEMSQAVHSRSVQPLEVESLRREVERLKIAAEREGGLLDAVLRHSPHGIIISDPDGKLIIQNEAAERIWAGSATANSVEDWKNYRAFHPDGRPYTSGDWQMARALASQMQQQAEEFHIQRFDDTHGYLLGSSAPIFGTSHKLLGAVCIFADITHLRGVEAALRVSEGRFSTTLHSIGDAVIATDAAGRVTFMNPVAETLTQLRSRDALGRTLDDIFHLFSEHTRARVESPVTKVIREGTTAGLANHTVLVREDGTELAIEDSAAPIRNECGALAGVVLVFRDVTVKRREEARRRFVAEASHELASSLDHQTILKTVAQLAVPTFADWTAVDLVADDGSICRLSVAHVDPKKVERVTEIARLYPTDRRAARGVPNIIRTGQSEMMTEITDELLVALAKDATHLGMIRNLGLRSYIGVPLVARGRILGALTFATAESKRNYTAEDLALAEDVGKRAALALDNSLHYQAAQQSSAIAEKSRTEAERHLLALEEERSRLTAVLDQMPAGVMIAEAPSGRVIYSNNQATEIFHGPVTSVERGDEYHRTFKVWHPDGNLYTSEEFPLVRAVAGETVRGEEILFLRADGSEGVVRANAAPFRDTSGRILGAVTAYYDATALKRAAEERERLYAEARAALRSRDDLLAIVSHDLRSPLSAITIAARLIAQAASKSDASNALKQSEIITRSAERMDRLIEDLLDIAAIEAGQLSVTISTMEVQALLQEVAETMGILANRSRVRVSIDDRTRAERVMCDRDRVLQVFANLVGNAVKFSTDEETILVTSCSRDEWIEFSVNDSGPGISAEDLPHLFERYWQGERRSGRGVGLGLTIAKGIVEAHQGRIWAESTVGTGSTFHFTLPLAPRDAEKKT
jgi:PAS domain S-box-containing protein